MAQPVGPLFGTRWPNRGPGSVPARTFPALALLGAKKFQVGPRYGFSTILPGGVRPVKRKKKRRGDPIGRLSSGDPAELLGKKQMGHFLVRSGFAAGCRHLLRHDGPQVLHGRAAEQQSDSLAANTAMAS